MSSCSTSSLQEPSLLICELVVLLILLDLIILSRVLIFHAEDLKVNSLFKREVSSAIFSNYGVICCMFVSFSDDLSSLNYIYIKRLPDTPEADGDNSILSFYVTLESGRTMPLVILASIYVAQQEKIFSVESALINQTDRLPTPEEVTPRQIGNTVKISLSNIPLQKVRRSKLYPTLLVSIHNAKIKKLDCEMLI